MTNAANVLDRLKNSLNAGDTDGLGTEQPAPVQITRTIEVTDGYAPTAEDPGFVSSIRSAVEDGGVFEVVALPGTGTHARLLPALQDAGYGFYALSGAATRFDIVEQINLVSAVISDAKTAATGKVVVVIIDHDRGARPDVRDRIAALVGDLDEVQAIALTRTLF